MFPYIKCRKFPSTDVLNSSGFGQHKSFWALSPEFCDAVNLTKYLVICKFACICPYSTTTTTTTMTSTRGPYQLSWTLTFRVSTSQLGPSTSPSTESLNWVPQLGPSTWSLNLVPQLGLSTGSFNLVPQLAPLTWFLNFTQWTDNNRYALCIALHKGKFIRSFWSCFGTPCSDLILTPTPPLGQCH